MWIKILDLLLMFVPLIVEAFNKKRSEEETAKEYVKRQQKERLKTYEALEKETGEELSRLSWERIHRAMLLRVHSKVREPSPNESDVSDKGAELPPSGG